jgi:hypothetical protein
VDRVKLEVNPPLTLVGYSATAADFLDRHQDKLMFGSDCFCSDGKGTGLSQANNPRQNGSMASASHGPASV